MSNVDFVSNDHFFLQERYQLQYWQNKNQSQKLLNKQFKPFFLSIIRD